MQEDLKDYLEKNYKSFLFAGEHIDCDEASLCSKGTNGVLLVHALLLLNQVCKSSPYDLRKPIIELVSTMLLKGPDKLVDKFETILKEARDRNEQQKRAD